MSTYTAKRDCDQSRVDTWWIWLWRRLIGSIAQTFAESVTNLTNKTIVLCLFRRLSVSDCVSNTLFDPFWILVDVLVEPRLS